MQATLVQPRRVDTEFAEIVAGLRKVRHDAFEVTAKAEPFQDPATPVRESEDDVPAEDPDDSGSPEPDQAPDPDEGSPR